MPAAIIIMIDQIILQQLKGSTEKYAFHDTHHLLVVEGERFGVRCLVHVHVLVSQDRRNPSPIPLRCLEDNTNPH